MKSRLGPSINATFTFDDYGALMCTRTDVSDSIGGKHLTITNVSTLKNGVAVLYDPLKKIGRRSMQPDVAVNCFPDFATMSDSAKLALKYKKLGTMTVAGRTCQGHSIERHGIVVTAWLWEGIPLRTESMYAPRGGAGAGGDERESERPGSPGVVRCACRDQG
ncbi:MAG: hypothetical protein JST22_05800 [Bacteroidetes bacterium]|nr:hypothetical protein [Bacteroidota bacterium]